MDKHEFEREWLATAPAFDEPLYLLAMEYHRRAEAYDRTVCHCKRGDTAMPADGRELALVNRNARELINEIIQREGLDLKQAAEFRRCIRNTSRQFEQELQRSPWPEPIQRQAP